ncbi:MAG: ferritin family protein [Bacillota bacterium]
MRFDWKEKIEAAIKDELEAASFYNQLASSAPNTVIAQILSSMAADEYGHARILTAMMADKMTMAFPTIDPFWGKTGRDDFRRNLEQALEGELEAIAEYAEFARMSTTLEQKTIFLSIVGDEYGHARVFITLLAGGVG